ncbi:hypothetical protein [Candidatus Frankia alpina]|uniref:hypothetical protein n=1 Tax=Candidatus Frankia alpina TaxID=2699483 RepID=UPI002E25435E
MTPRRLRTIRAIWTRVVWGERRAPRDGRSRARRDGRGADDGSAMIEFVGLSVVLLVPFVYLFLCVFSVQKSAFGVTEAAREAGRAFATADSETEGTDRARLAAALALQDQGVSRRAADPLRPGGRELRIRQPRRRRSDPGTGRVVRHLCPHGRRPARHRRPVRRHHRRHRQRPVHRGHRRLPG